MSRMGDLYIDEMQQNEVDRILLDEQMTVEANLM